MLAIQKGDGFSVLDHGYVKYIDSMGTEESIIEAARMSTGRGFTDWDAVKECTLCGVRLPASATYGLLCAEDCRVPEGKNHVWKDIPGDANLLEFLYANFHMTPFEMCELLIEVSAPIFVFREWHRHRTQCLAGDTKLHFDLPGGIERRGTQKYTMTIKEVFEKFQPTVRKDRPERQTNAFFPRQRIQAMRLRCLNEETKEVTHTSIVDVWESGVKPVYDVEIEGVGKIRCSKDHRFFTPEGWKRLEQLADLDQLDLKSFAIYGTPVYVVQGATNESTSFEVPAVEVEEQWKPVVGWEEWYEISDMGRIRRIAGGQGVRTQGTTKVLSSDMTGYLCTTLNRPGKQTRAHVHRLVLEAFIGPCPEGKECRHIDGNQKNNWLANLAWGTPAENAEDRVRHGRVPSLKSWAKNITSITLVGQEMTYDIEVADPWHNFVAEGFVVHNSYNEFSARYAKMDNKHYLPELARFQKQASANKQGSADAFDEQLAETWRSVLSKEQAEIYEHYDELVAAGLAKEVARINTPVSRYSRMRAKADLRCWLGFLLLRMKPNAQWEIRQYADIVGKIIEQLWPRTYKLFMEYTFDALNISRAEKNLVEKLIELVHPTVLVEMAVQQLGSEKKARAFLSKFGMQILR